MTRMTPDEMALVALVGSFDVPITRKRAAAILFGGVSRSTRALLLSKTLQRLADLGFVVPREDRRPLSLSPAGRLLLAFVLHEDPSLLAAYYGDEAEGG